MLRIGTLGAANITDGALLTPAAAHPEVEVVAVAARTRTAAQDFAERHGIPRVHDDYAALVHDPEIDAVYNPLPNGLHGHWTIEALRAGKHVLCEKPFAANADEADAVARVARESGLVVMEAFHYRYHPMTAQIARLIASGAIGTVRRYEAWFRGRLPAGDIRWQVGLAGGALMDLGCYPVHLVRTLAAAEPTIVSATAVETVPGIDSSLRAELTFADGRTASVSGSMAARRPRASGGRVIGSRGWLEISGFVAPQHGGRLRLHTAGGTRRLRVPRLPTSYDAQLGVFADAVLRGASYPTGVDDAVATMRVIDACYLAAGLPLRQPTVTG